MVLPAPVTSHCGCALAVSQILLAASSSADRQEYRCVRGGLDRRGRSEISLVVGAAGSRQRETRHRFQKLVFPRWFEGHLSAFGESVES
jgi:hypothetical protein